MYQIKKHLEILLPKCFIPSVPGRVRTVDPLIKSQLLYQLSYRDIFCLPRPNAKPRKGPFFKSECKDILYGKLTPKNLPKF
jgi:hypothetical protein